MINKETLLFYFTLVYLLVFTTVAITNKNWEFLYYILIMSIFLLIILRQQKKIKLHTPLLTGLSIVGLIHLLGGTIYFNNMRLYDVWIIPDFLKYDNMVHFTAIFVITFVAYNLLYPHLDKKIEQNKIMLAILLVLITLGIGAVNEIFELMAVLYFNATQQVGDYTNNAFDLVFNFMGAISACILIMIYDYTSKNRKK